MLAVEGQLRGTA